MSEGYDCPSSAHCTADFSSQNFHHFANKGVQFGKVHVYIVLELFLLLLLKSSLKLSL